jgi:excisionase family DNA binding protein
LKILHYHAFSFLGLTTTMPIQTVEGEILTIKQVADFLKVTERTIYRLAAAKKIPAFKVGGTWRFSRADIDIWIKQQSVGGFTSAGDKNNVADGQPNKRERK